MNRIYRSATSNAMKRLVCRADWAASFGGEIPRPPFKDPAEKQRFAQWRMDRWNACHAHMKAVLNEHHPVRAVFQSSPYCLFQRNPWITGVYLPEMVKHIDGITAYTYLLQGAQRDVRDAYEGSFALDKYFNETVCSGPHPILRPSQTCPGSIRSPPATWTGSKSRTCR